MFGGHGNSFHGTGGRDNKLSQLCYTLRLLLSVCGGGGGGGGGGEEWILQDLHEQGAIPLIIGNGEREGEGGRGEGEGGRGEGEGGRGEGEGTVCTHMYSFIFLFN